MMGSFAIDSAMDSVRASDSMTHGPAMSSGFAPSPTVMFPIRAVTGTARYASGARAVSRRCVVLLRFGGAHKSEEKRMRAMRPALELGVELARDEIGMVGDLDDLHQASIRRGAADKQSRALEALAILVVHFPAVAMALADFVLTVELGGQAPRSDLARPRAQAHGAALLAGMGLAFHQVDDGVGAARAELGRERIFDAAYVTRKFDHRALQSQAD